MGTEKKLGALELAFLVISATIPSPAQKKMIERASPLPLAASGRGSAALQSGSRRDPIARNLRVGNRGQFGPERQTRREATAHDAPLGILVPGRSGVPNAVEVAVTLSIPMAFTEKGFGVKALATGSFALAGRPSGGKTLAASDFGIGVVRAYSTPAAGIKVTPGFDYDPAQVGDHQGSNPFTGLTGGRGTVDDLSSGREVLRVEKLSTQDKPQSTMDLTVVVKLASRPQYSSPGAFTGSIVLTVVQ